jgi:hypothetical protein
MATMRRRWWGRVGREFPTIFSPRVQNERRWLITADKGLANLRRHPPGSHAGVILLRAQEESRRTYLELAALALERLKLDELVGALVVVTYRGARIRRAPLK